MGGPGSTSCDIASSCHLLGERLNPPGGAPWQQVRLWLQGHTGGSSRKERDRPACCGGRFVVKPITFCLHREWHRPQFPYKDAPVCTMTRWLPQPPFSRRTREISVPYFSTVLIPIPGTASNSWVVPGRLVARALSVRSLKIRNAGTPRRRASTRRQTRSAASRRESGPATVSGLDACFRPAETGGFVCLFRLAGGGTVSFMMTSTGVLSSMA